MAVAAAGLYAGSAAAIITSNSQLYINDYLGADRFYEAGYTGTRAVAANIEGGHAWNLHETLTHLSTLLHAPGGGPGNVNLGDFDFHATETAHIIAGRGGLNQHKGIAYGAELWSGAIATVYPNAPTGTNFNYSISSLRHPYEKAMVDGVGGRTADVINSSWGVSSSANTSAHQFPTAMIDALAFQSGKTVTVAAGNAGSSANTVLPPGTGFNVITVGALGAEQGVPPYNVVASFSSRGPADFRDAQTGQVLTGVRAPIDLVAPGTAMRLAKYGGTTGSNTGGTDSTNGSTTMYHNFQSGTSFSAPMVAGGAALLVDAGYDLYGGGQSIDGRVVKAVLMNSADKTHNWNNGQSMVSGVVTTTQSLDYNAGAGRMNLDAAFDQYTAGTANVAGSGGGDVAAIGWDYGIATDQAANDYFITKPLIGGTKFDVTLTWFVDAFYSSISLASYGHYNFIDLNLQVWSVVDGMADSLVAESVSVHNNTEHLSFAVPHFGEYMVRVLWQDEIFDLLDAANEAVYGLAWRGLAAQQGDMNGDGQVNTEDINPFILAMTNPAAYALQFPHVDMVYVGDASGDGLVNTEDINGFISLLTGGGGGQSMAAFAVIPEPSSLAVCGLALLLASAGRWGRKIA